MKTVGEFKKARLEFVDGDSGENFLVKNPVSFNGYGASFENDLVKFFAWRENTGVNPEFQGLIEAVVGNNKDISVGYKTDFFCWKLDVPYPVIKWRPSLNQSSDSEYDNTAQQVEALALNDKPTFTQAMADAGELPPFGVVVQIKSLNDAEPCFINGELIYVRHGKVWYRDDKRGDEIGFIDKLEFKPLDTRTDREKAIDEMASLISLRARDGAKEVCGELYDAGYRKC